MVQHWSELFKIGEISWLWKILVKLVKNESKQVDISQNDF